MAALFCYGTLEIESVITRLIGRVPQKQPAILENFVRYLIKNSDFPAIIPSKNGEVVGTLYLSLTPKEIRILDEYEGNLYSRQQLWVTTDIGRLEHSWAFVLKPQYQHHLSDQLWDVEKYLSFKSTSNRSAG